MISRTSIIASLNFFHVSGMPRINDNRYVRFLTMSNLGISWMPTIYTTLDIYLIRADVNKAERMLVGPIVLVGPPNSRITTGPRRTTCPTSGFVK